jgi:hypothetical protein
MTTMNNIDAGTSLFANAGGRGARDAAPAEFVVLPKTMPTPSAVPALPTTDEITAPDPEEARMEQLQRAAENYKAFFPVGDVRFSIYKDVGGQYITRFTNLINGKVTQVPEHALLASMGQSNGGQMPAIFKTLV